VQFKTSSGIEGKNRLISTTNILPLDIQVLPLNSNTFAELKADIFEHRENVIVSIVKNKKNSLLTATNTTESIQSEILELRLLDPITKKAIELNN